MEKRKWKWLVDQWFEDKVWVKVPEEYSSPHYFFVIGFLSGFILLLFLSCIF